MKILAIIPTHDELKYFIQAYLEQGYQSKTIHTGRLSVTYFAALETVVASGGLGKVQFAVHTQHLIDIANWDLIICAGAAGALLDSFAVGDVIIATETVEHDIRNRFGKPLLPRFSGSKMALENCRQALQTLPEIHIHYGPIASGDEDVIDSDRQKALHTQTGALAVAWEGAGGARACQFSEVSYLEIRGVTDNANSTAAQDFELNLKAVMKNVATVVISLANWSVNGEGAG